MAEINESDLFGKGVIEAPLHLAKNLGESVSQLDALIQRGKEFEKIFGPTTVKSLGSVKKEVEALSLAEIELEKIQKQIAIATAKDNDEYAKQVKKLKEVRDSLKEKTKITEKEAKATKAETASIDQLTQALNKNKAAYKQLAGDQQRQSAAGKELKKVIDSQDEALKKLNKSLGDHSDEVGHYELAQGALNEQLGGFIDRAKNLGQQLFALATNPFFLVIAAAVATFKALQAAANYYYTTTLEGEEAAKRSENTWKSFFLTFKEQALEAGKQADQTNNKLKQFLADALLRLGVEEGVFSKEADQIVAKRKWLNQQLNLLSNQISRIMVEHIKDVVDDANTELKVNELLEQSKNKLRLTDEERLIALRKAKDLLQDQAKGDVDLAKADLALYESYIKLNGGIITRGKLVTEYNDAEIKALKITGDEVKHLGDLQAAVIKVESDAAAKRKMLLKQEIALVQEIEAARVAAIRTRQDAENKINMERLQTNINENKRIFKEEELSAERELALTQAIGEQENQVIKKQQQEQLLIIRRAAEDRNKEAAQIMAGKELEKNANLTAAEFIKIQDKFLNQLIAKDKAYLNERKAINEQYDDQLVENNLKTKQAIATIQEKFIMEQLADFKRGLDEEIALIQSNAIGKGLRAREKANKAILEAHKANGIKYIQESINQMTRILQIENLPLEEAKKIRDKLAQLKIDLVGAIFAAEDNDPYEHIKKVIGRVQEIFNEFSFSIGNLFQSLTDRRLQQIDREDKALQKQHENYQDRLDKELEDFIGTEEDKKAFEAGIRKQKEVEERQFEQKQEDLEHKRIAAQRKAAEYDKAVSAVQAAIATSLAVTKLLATPPLAIAAGIAGAIQVAAILARPIPQFYEGGTAPGGPIITGELGAELMREPSGKTYLSKPFANVMHGVPAGTQIFDHDSTMRMLALSGLGIDERPAKINGSNEDLKKLLVGVRDLNHTVKTKKETHFHFDKNGVEAYMRKSETTIKLLNKLWR